MSKDDELSESVNKSASSDALEEPTDFIDSLIERGKQLMENYWHENPDLYEVVQIRKKEQALAQQSQGLPIDPHGNQATNEANRFKPYHPFELQNKVKPFVTDLKGKALRQQCYANHQLISAYYKEWSPAFSEPRTNAVNRKHTYASFEEECVAREELLAQQIKTWRAVLPGLMAQFNQIKDFRRLKSTKHKLTSLLLFGLLGFVFRLESRRAMNRELTGTVLYEHLKRLFPELTSIPHADTLARVLEGINPQAFECIQLSLIKSLILKKKFRKLLIEGCLPVAIDGTQKLYRKGLAQDEHWCERKVAGNVAELALFEKRADSSPTTTAGSSQRIIKQQYVYVLEANIVFKNGLTLPLMTEYLYRDNNALKHSDKKQDSELSAFNRLAARLKAFFPRQKLLLMMDALFATRNTLGLIHENRWEYLVSLPKAKLKGFAKKLNKQRKHRRLIPEHYIFNKRKQSFYWHNGLHYGETFQFPVHLIGCLEEWASVNRYTGAIEMHHSEKCWLSSLPARKEELHVLLNEGARKLGLIEDNFNTEKNRGYHYKHAYSYNWNAMRGFHYLMRLGHLINALSEFTKRIKESVKKLGCSATHKLIKETLFNPWLSFEWYSAQLAKAPQFRLQLE